MRVAREGKHKAASSSDDAGLDVVAVVITAATPMEEVDRPFPGVEEEEQQEQEPPQQQQQQQQPPEVAPEEATVQEVEPERKRQLKKAESEEKSVLDDQPTDSAPFPVSSSSGSDAESVSGPSTGENSQCGTGVNRQGGPACVEEEQEEEQAVSPPRKMLVGGRASIPDELQPDQLQKLQDLKESNA